MSKKFKQLAHVFTTSHISGSDRAGTRSSQPFNVSFLLGGRIYHWPDVCCLGYWREWIWTNFSERTNTGRCITMNLLLPTSIFFWEKVNTPSPGIVTPCGKGESKLMQCTFFFTPFELKIDANWQGWLIYYWIIIISLPCASASAFEWTQRPPSIYGECLHAVDWKEGISKEKKSVNGSDHTWIINRSFTDSTNKATHSNTSCSLTIFWQTW